MALLKLMKHINLIMRTVNGLLHIVMTGSDSLVKGWLFYARIIKMCVHVCDGKTCGCRREVVFHVQLRLYIYN